MQIRIMETGETKSLVYRSWNGMRYGADEAADIIKQHQAVAFDRSVQAYIMSRRDYEAWAQYFRHMERDEKLIRRAYQVYRSSDVDKALKAELDLVYDTPSLHHKARKAALQKLKEGGRKRAAKFEYVYDDVSLSIRYTAKSDGDIIDMLKRADDSGLSKSREVKRYIRLGLEREKELAEQRDADLAKLRTEGWL